MEGHCWTGQNLQWAVVPMEEEEEGEEEEEEINCHFFVYCTWVIDMNTQKYTINVSIFITNYSTFDLAPRFDLNQAIFGPLNNINNTLGKAIHS